MTGWSAAGGCVASTTSCAIIGKNGVGVGVALAGIPASDMADFGEKDWAKPGVAQATAIAAMSSNPRITEKINPVFLAGLAVWG